MIHHVKEVLEVELRFSEEENHDLLVMAAIVPGRQNFLRGSMDHKSNLQVDSSKSQAETSSNSPAIPEKNHCSEAQSTPKDCDTFADHANKAAQDLQERSHSVGAPTKPGSEQSLAQKQRTSRRRCQQPKMLSSPEDTMYYNQLNGALEYQGSKRKPRKLGQIKVLDGEDEYYKSLSPVDPEEDSSAHPFFFPSSSKGAPFAQL
ncbi:myosin-IIIb-like [Sorex fumeus]|uniref:myosin-IIIb-like n=1 Tax=Sorex fumeus TaxID=62283 RepID=UPI0024AE81CE|nr:myosin-IIIb-like [Sorex fumeus]